MSDHEEKYLVKWTSRFKKEYKLAQKRGCDIGLLKEVVHLIAMGDRQQRLIDEYDDHALSGNWKGHRELRHRRSRCIEGQWTNEGKDGFGKLLYCGSAYWACEGD